MKNTIVYGHKGTYNIKSFINCNISHVVYRPECALVFTLAEQNTSSFLFRQCIEALDCKANIYSDAF